MDENTLNSVSKSLHLAGFFTTHGMGSIVDWKGKTGDGIIPILGIELSDGTRTLMRIVFDDKNGSTVASPTVYERIENILKQKTDWVAAALVMCGSVDSSDSKTKVEAIIASSYINSHPSPVMTFFSPYRRVKKGFLGSSVELGHTGVLQLDYEVLDDEQQFTDVVVSFDEGLLSHHEAFIWSRHKVDNF